MLIRHYLILLALFPASFATQAQIMPLPPCCPEATSVPSGPAQLRCAALRPGMGLAEVVAVMGRDPDSTLSGHAEPEPGGAAASTDSVDEWYSADEAGYHLTTRVHYRGGVVDQVECGKPVVFQPLPQPPPSL